MNEFLEQFLVEARELVEQATADLLALERDPDDRTSLDGSFRAFHTLKGAPALSTSPRWSARCMLPRMFYRWFAGAIARSPRASSATA